MHSEGKVVSMSAEARRRALPDARGLSPIRCKDLSDLISRIETETSNWTYVWYRGDRDRFTLTPKIFRKTKVSDGSNTSHRSLDESRIIESIRRRISALDVECEYITDELCLAQHFFVPTRLLDWSEHIGTALYFATPNPDANPHIWTLNPLALNAVYLACKNRQISYAELTYEAFKHQLDEFGSTIFAAHKFDIRCYAYMAQGRGECYTEGAESITFDSPFVRTPLAFIPHNVHDRISHQNGCMTIHGRDEEDFETIFGHLDPQITDEILKLFCFEGDFLDRLSEVRHLCPNPMHLFGDIRGFFMDIEASEVWATGKTEA